MGLTKDSLREGQTSGAFLGLLYAYDLIGESRKRLTHMRGEVWNSKVISHTPTLVNPHARGSLGGRQSGTTKGYG